MSPGSPLADPPLPTLYYITALFNNFRRSSYKLFATYTKCVCIYNVNIHIIIMFIVTTYKSDSFRKKRTRETYFFSFEPHFARLRGT